MNNILIKTSPFDYAENTNALSPFASRDNEYIVIEPHPEKLRYISQYNMNELTKSVLFAMNKLLFSTSIQIKSILSKEMDAPIEAVRKALKYLFSGGYINRLRFSDGEAVSNYCVYFIANGRGAALYKSVFGVYPDKLRYAESITSPIRIKSYLAANQLMSQVDNIDVYHTRAQVHMTPKRFLRKQKKIPVNARFNIGNNTVICESFRSNDNPDYISEVFKHIGIIISSEKLEPEIEHNPKIVLILEDKQHMTDFMKLIPKALSRYPDLFFTYDRALLGDFSGAFFKLHKNEVIAA